MFHVKPVDPRLLRYAHATRGFLVAVVVLGLAGAGLVIGQAMLIAEIVVGAFQHHLGTGALATPLALLAAVSVGRGLVSWLTELAAHRAGAAVKSELRMRLIERAARLGPGAVIGGTDGGTPAPAPNGPGAADAGTPDGTGTLEMRTGELTTLATRGIDALDDYFARYLPQLGLAVVVPLAVLARIVTGDWISALTIVLTLPLIPLFMILIGWATQARMDRQWRLLARLSGHFLDVVEGLPTLKVFGRAKAQAASIRAITGAYRRATMRTLRIAFLSSFALELLATISVALVAVGIGMRLVHGELDLYTGLMVLVLAPEAYLPLRQVGAQYHAAAEGLSAAEEIFAVLETPLRTPGTAPAPEGTALTVEELVVRHPGRTADSLPATSFEVRPGETVALVGPSGAGKSTLLSVLLGFTAPYGGRALVDGRDIASLSPESWRQRIAWVPQHPHLFAGTIAENVRLARPEADDAAVRNALGGAGALDFIDALPDGMATRLGESGAGLSAGQRQRLALARAFLADRPVLLLDEPTANLDGATEEAMVAAIGRLAVGRTVLLVVHRPALLAVADRVVRLPGAVVEAPSDRSGRSVQSGRSGRSVQETVAEPAEGGRGSAEAAAGAPDPGEDAGPDSLPGPARGSALTRLRRTARSHRARFALALLLGSLALGSAVGLMATSGWLISRAAQQPPVLYLMVAVTATRAFGIGRAVFRYAERLVAHDAVFRMLAEARVAVFRRLERLAPAGLKERNRGDLLSRLVADVDAGQDYFLRWLLPVGAAVLVGAGAVGFTGWLLPEAGALLAVGLLLAGVGVPMLSGALARRAERQLAPARGQLATRVVDVLTGTAELTVAGALPARTEAVRDADRELTRIASRSATVSGTGAGLSALLCGLTVAAAAVAGIQAVHAGRLSGVALAVVVLTPLAAFEAVTGLPLAVQYRRRTRHAAERVFEVLDAPVPVQEPTAPAEAPEAPFPLVVRDLTARHPGADRPALDGVGFTVTAGRRLAVVGPSGSGKTTLAQVLLRFVDRESGAYLLGGTDAGTLDGDAVRRLVGLCAQDAHLFDSSLRENLKLARRDRHGASGDADQDLWEALGRARLADWVRGLPDGLDTMIGEHGARLSGGQRQRLALARALLADFPVLVLDEPAEHLDLATADALTADLLAATEGRTTVLITHRLTGLEEVDEVLVLDQGRVAQCGPYAELAAADGPFRRMLERERAVDAAYGAAQPVA
ncbi:MULTISPECIES: thiol reductant ABC exporter subunit CydD [unclassified Streptomyces]|uniref:thiol reductant ABC exporter subunit CydD n=1 Tax=unclassified Streptomyces TaxID=2593676 RepID=UPI00087FDEA4|nr:MULTISPECIES: thiol reductant ABC exporter subunit CydD [unclassified Streptomyces]PBC83749.1 ATP-binding cassette subfamily C protein CydCD [Streptomyces sp. 2321.6]SDR39180.1 ATP-binding cassette, subfamily C, CydCD [Streptomyces sp. KS_16]SED06704.1 ATP-binding cassette, subfamily C, CydCD [Streptomyces sp. 2133.1]SNC69828.1 ATP-binding cassette, subfamily C, CydCD [Streptomyces sp. 2114.4]